MKINMGAIFFMIISIAIVIYVSFVLNAINDLPNHPYK